MSFKGRHHSEETKRKMGVAHKGKSCPGETKKKISEALKGHSGYYKGKNLSEEHKKKISEANMGHPVYGGFQKGHTLTRGQIPWNKGGTLSKEHRRKIGEASKGQVPWIKGKHHSEESRKKTSRAIKGKKHPNWRGGITPEIKRIRRSIETRLWREAVFARDNWTCQKCGKRGGTELCAHHIKDFSTYLESRFAIDNGITFCEKCHRRFHQKFGNLVTEKELEEFLND